MRIDEIDLIGNFTINGLSPQTDQFLGLSGSELFWLDPAPSQSGFSIYGNRYVYCNSVEGNQVSSGTNLKNAYASASAFIVSATARGAVLVSPGVYDFNNSPLNLTASYIDIVGISSDANSVLLKATNANYTLKYRQGVDSGLFNVGITGGNVLGILGSASTYLRWDNIIVNGDCFYESTTPTYAFENLKGEFKNIKLRNSSHFGFGYFSIDGTFDNIQADLLGDIFKNEDYGTSRGTFSNISIGTCNDIFQLAGTFSGDLKNIKIKNGNAFIVSSDTISCDLENVELGNLTGNCFVTNGLLTGNYKNLKIGNATSSYLFYVDDINGTFEDIEISGCGYAFRTTSDITGTFSNIQIGEVVNNLFQSVSGNISGNFSNIKVYSGLNIAFFADNNIYGTFDKIDLGNLTGNLFTANNNISGTFSNIKIGNNSSAENYFSATGGSLLGDFENIEIGNSDNVTMFYADTDLIGTFKNINVSTSNSMFTTFTSRNIDGVFENIECGTVSASIFSSSGTMSGTFSNIKIGNVTSNSFYSVSSLQGTYENIEIKSTNTTLFKSDDKVIGTFENISVDDINSTQGFHSINGTDGVFKNIEVKSGSGTNIFFYADGASVTGTFDNININSPMTSFIVSSGGDVIGTFSNITALNPISISAFSSTNDLSGTFKNITMGTVSSLGGSFSLPVLIDNLSFRGYISSSQFLGKIINSSIDSTGLSNPTIYLGNGAVVERCKFLSDSGDYTIKSSSSINAQISLTRANQDIDTQITNLIDTPLNILE